jgi:hypothetical protein
MEPFSIFLVAFLIMKGFKIAKVDREYAKRGEVPPGYRLAQQLLDRKKSAGAAPTTAKVKPYGARGYARQRWLALWEDLGEKHEEQRAAHKAAVAAAKAAGRPAPRRPTLKQRLAAGWQWAITPVGEPRPGTPTDRPRTACPDCGQTLIDRDGRWRHPSSAGCPNKPLPTDGQPHGTNTTTNQPTKPDRAEPADNKQPVGAPTPQGADPRPPTSPQEYPPTQGGATTNQGGTHMSGSSGEVTGLASAVTYANEVAATHDEHGSGEGFVSSLASFEVGQGDIAKVLAAQEASRNAGALWREAAQALQDSNNAVKEAYSTSPDAGNKQFATQE